ncbi:hypothetical protein C900_02065 [Fulvivirga imtechensis AK7]|uniref:Secretion system C-terminal sorting domain-containing protein n=1 Tax=Fulvivirga imtechensis AK7 TaxID=1237149 RepID=L8JX57_9BACT|nr:hypothetical protein [Fulvivirga imtechensis]ELR73661.1 hypothetical protein C900_02065 [Fulvivirga imtechensis AK7]
MKTLTTMAALLIAGASVYANVNGITTVDPKKSVAIIQNVQAKYKLVYLKESKGTVRIDILNEAGKQVHSQSVSNDGGFAQQFDFSSLPYGMYTFEVTHPDGTKIAEVVNHLKPEKAVSTGLRAGVLDINDNNKFRLAVLKSNSDPINVKIYDEQNRLLHEDVIAGDEGFRKTYDLKNVKASSFRFEVSDNNSTVTMFSK